MEDLSSLRSKRGTLKGILTRNDNFVNDEVGLAAATKAMLEIRRDKTVSTFEGYENINIDISKLCPDDKEDVSEIEKKYYNIMSKINEALSKFSKTEIPDSNISNSKLPDIDIPHFDGRDFTKFKPFIDLFAALIGNNKSLSDIQKLFYLRKYLISDALSVIVNLPLVNESYEEALLLLKKRYDNKARLISNHISHLLDLPPMQKGTAASIRAFVCEVQQQLHALKNLGQPTNQWDMLLISVLTRKLDSYTCRAFHLDRTDPDKLPTLEDFIKFLERRAIALEDSPTIKGNFNDFTSGKSSATKVSNMVTKDKAKPTYNCIYCNNIDHPVYLCPTFQTLAPGDRVEFINLKKLCNICLRLHNNKCKYHFKCKICKSDHNTLLHMESPVDEKVGMHCNQQASQHVLLPTIKIKLRDKFGHYIYAKALVDSGSQASLIQSQLVSQLNLKPIDCNTNIIGICSNANKLNKSANVIVHSDINNVKFQVKCHIVDTITTKLPQNFIDISNINLPKNVKLADSDFNVPSEIQLLLGADFYFKIIQDGHLKLNNGIILQNTLFGHIIGGVCTPSVHEQHCDTQTVNIVSNFVINESKSDLTEIMDKFWLSEKIPEELEVTSESQLAEDCFKKSTQLIDNRFHVNMPLKVPMDQLELGDSFSIALQRFYSLEKKFHVHSEYFQQYKHFIDEYVNLGHAKIVDISNYDVNNDPVYFLAHHAVLNEDSKTTKLRVVFNGSMNSRNKVSLNDKMANGPTVQNELFDILLLFRTYLYTLMCDIEKMFRQVYLNKNQAGLINILWRDSPDKPILCLQLQTVTYGLKSSTFLATRCLVELALRFHDEFPLASEAIMKNTYVDDVISGSDDVEQLRNLKHELIELLKKGSFHLHKWCSNVDGVLHDIPEKEKFFDQIDINKDNTIKTLGLKYNVTNDTLTFTAPKISEKKQLTKRQILSFIGKMFDPLGLIGPIIVRAKIFMQDLWSLKIDWDSPLPEKKLQEWDIFLKDLQYMGNISIPRGVVTKERESVELIGYCDASSKALGCCLYLRILYTDKTVENNLLCSKSRVAPLNKSLTIPNMELNGSLLLAELVHRVHNTLKTRFPLKVILYSDSQIVLAWLNSNNLKCEKYVSRRVAKIKKLTTDCTWCYVKSAENPADLLSRGISPQKLQNNILWWHGPQNLSTADFKHEAFFSNKKDSEPIYNTDIHINVCKSDSDFNLLDKYSDINKLQRIVAYILRFSNNCKNKNKDSRVYSSLTPQELNNSLLIIIKNIQKIHFEKEIESLTNDVPLKSGIVNLHPFLDKNNLLRVGGRLQNSTNISYDKMHPIILPKSSNITYLLIEREHLRMLHAGPKQVFSSLSQKFWIINGIREVKKVLHKCVKCFKLKAIVAKQLMGSLPSQRITASRPFEVTGVDFCGPFNLKIARIRKPIITKSYIAIFVCFSTKAVHAELVSDLTTEAFLACLKRFMARRGMPQQIISDNAQTFKGAANKFKELYNLNSSKEFKDSINDYCTKNYISFKQIPSYSPEFGGLWEAGVKSLKFHLKRIVGSTILTFEALYTVVTEIEAILNSRPLLPISSDVSNFEYLTPGHFLIGTALTSYPDVDFSSTSINRLSFWNILSKIKQDFWKVWSRDYLTLLQSRPKWKQAYPNLKEGDLVIVRSDNTAPLSWPMARIVKVIPGQDGKVRVAEIKMSNNKIYKRSYRKLCPLPLE